ncbi:PREDICTED: protein kinase C delta type-like, partial [Priapulus caudatus]
MPQGFLRVKLMVVEPAGMFRDPFCAVNVKETIEISGHGPQLVQKKRTIFPGWNACFDAHTYDGRVINIVVMDRSSSHTPAKQ